MELNIRVEKLEKGRYPKVYIDGKKYVGCTPELAEKLIEGKEYRVLLNERLVNLKDGNSFKARDIVAVLSASPVPELVKTNGHSKEESIKTNIEMKNKSIEQASVLKAKSVALEAACVMVKAYGEACAVSGVLNGLKEHEIKDWLLSMKKTQFDENMKLLGLEPEEQF